MADYKKDSEEQKKKYQEISKGLNDQPGFMDKLKTAYDKLTSGSDNEVASAAEKLSGKKNKNK